MRPRFSPEEKEQLFITDNLGRRIKVTLKHGEPFCVYVSIDPPTNEIITLHTGQVTIP